MELGWIIVLIILGLAVFNLYRGYQKGAIHELALLISLFLTILLMRFLIIPIALRIVWAQYFSLFNIVAFIVVWLILKHWVKKWKFINKISLIGFFNRLLGMIIGEIKAFILIVLVMIVTLSPVIQNGYYAIQNNPILYKMNEDFRIVIPFYDEYYQMMETKVQMEENNGQL